MKAKTTALNCWSILVCSNPTAVPHIKRIPVLRSPLKTLNIQPGISKEFETIEAARDFCRRFFACVQRKHLTQVFGLMTPIQGPLRTGPRLFYAARQEKTLDTCVHQHAERFVRSHPGRSHPGLLSG